MEKSTLKSPELDRKELFEKAPVPKALAAFAVPTVISQLISMIYNLADTYFVGRTDNPYMVAAVTLCFALYMSLNAFGQLFGIGGGVLTSKLLGAYKEDEAKRIGCFSFYSSLIVSIILATVMLCFQNPILRFLGASDETIGYAREYLIYVVAIGGIPTVTSIAFSHLLRNEGYAKEASFGLSMGGVLNLFLDPLFMFVILPDGQEVKGAALATMISNYLVICYYLGLYFKFRKTMIISLDIRKYKEGIPYLGRIMSIGFPSFVAPFVATLANGTLNRLCAGHGDVAVAAFGIAKKIDMLPMNTAMGLCQGMVALVSYNYSNKNFKRMKSFIDTTRWIGISFACICIVVFELFTPSIIKLFIKDAATVEMGVMALRRMVLSTPLMISVFHMVYSYQSMGFGMKSLLLSVLRQGAVNIPLMFIMNKVMGLVGLYWNQFIADALVISVAAIVFTKDMKKIESEMGMKI